MKYLSILIHVLLIALTLSACGARAAPATPTIDPVNLQSTVAAQALTMIAQTQAAIPTATLPPTATITNTPPATDTPLQLPFAGLSLTPAPTTGTGGDDPCIHQVMPASLKGDPIKIRIHNTTKAAVSFSIYLNQAAPGADCGYRAYTIEAGQSLAINDLVQACYSLWAWNPDPADYFMVTNGTTCMMDSGEIWSFDISKGSLKLRQ